MPAGTEPGRPLPFQGSSGIRLVDGVDGHDIDCRTEGFGAVQLTSGVVKKA